MPIPFIMPKFDMDQESGTIITWLKKEGDQIQQDEAVLIVETQKVSIEVPAPASGILAGIRAQEGAIVPVTTVIAYILKDGEKLEEFQTTEQHGSPDKQAAEPESQQVSSDTPRVVSATPVAARMAKEQGIDLSNLLAADGKRITLADIESYVASTHHAGEKIAATPAARRLAKESGVSLHSVKGSGPNARIQAVDITRTIQTVESVSSMVSPEGERFAEIVPLIGMRRTIASRMQKSFQESPHIALTIDADMTRMEAVRLHFNKLAEKSKAAKVTLTALLVRLTSWALERNPYLNASLIGDNIYLWKDVNIGVATAMAEGLVVPVIHQSHTLTVSQIVDRLQDLTLRAREGRLELHDVQHGTFTISNLGMYGIRQFRAIINPPESAILAIGTVIRKPVVMGDEDDLIIRPICEITLSADHRVVDGVVATRFLSDLQDAIQAPETILY